jgi:hypothetical protein
VEEHLCHVDLHREDRPFAVDRHSVEVVGVSHDRRPAIDAQCIAASWHHEKRSNTSLLQHIEVAVRAPVTRPLREGDRHLIDDVGEARRIPLG